MFTRPFNFKRRGMSGNIPRIPIPPVTNRTRSSSLSARNIPMKMPTSPAEKNQQRSPSCNSSRIPKPVSSVVVLSAENITTRRQPSPAGNRPKLTPNRGVPIPPQRYTDDEVPRIDTKQMKKEFHKLRKPVYWTHNADRTRDMRMCDVPGSAKVSKEWSTMVDMQEKIDISERQEATPVLSNTGRSWEHSGYANSLSFLI